MSCIKNSNTNYLKYKIFIKNNVYVVKYVIFKRKISKFIPDEYDKKLFFKNIKYTIIFSKEKKFQNSSSQNIFKNYLIFKKKNKQLEFYLLRKNFNSEEKSNIFKNYLI